MMKTIGSRAEVFHKTAMKTSGGLKKGDLMQDKAGNIRSKAASCAALDRMKREGKKAMTKVFKPVKNGFKLQPMVGSKEYEKKIKKM
jgi:hypothetical protein|tara:strand:+ start:5061 stop:5321 length:261 start_codon:yes stop_codon:yes gene_type:complete